MDTTRLLHLLEAGDLTAWPDLHRDVERRADAEGAARALILLHAQGHVVEAAQWLSRVTDAPELQTLRAQVLAQSEGWTRSKLRALTQDLLRNTYRLIPAGSFIMGSPEGEAGRCSDETQHFVEITKPFLLKTSSVTQGEWLALMGENPARFKGDDRCPVENVSWKDAAWFCEVLSADTGAAYQLPTEAQWEYACRAGTSAARYGDLDAIAWHGGNSRYGLHPVGQKQPNAWGLHDMLGHVCEWCHDWFGPYPTEPQRDPQGSARGDGRVFRGRARSRDAMYCRAAQRGYYVPTYSSHFTGLRSAGFLY